MLIRLTEFLRRHEPLTRLLLRAALLVVLAGVAWDFHALTLDIAEIADRVDQIQDDIAGLRDSVDGDDGDSDASSQPLRAPI